MTGVNRQVIDLGFGVATIHRNHAPDDLEADGMVVLTIMIPESDSKPAQSLEIWHHEGLINLRDCLSVAIAEREEEIELKQSASQDLEEFLAEKPTTQRVEKNVQRDPLGGLTRL